jgi:methylase of polypeptide subunit release factors
MLTKLENHHSRRTALENILEFGDINEARLANVRRIFCVESYNLQIHCQDFLARTDSKTYDLIVANPPYARIMPDGKRAAKNHNMIGEFVSAAIARLKPDGYMLFIIPDNWMSRADRNKIARLLTSLNIIRLDIHSAKRYFKKIGSSFTWILVQNRPFLDSINVSGVWKNKPYEGQVQAGPRDYIPLLYSQLVHDILAKTIDAVSRPKFGVLTSSDLHKYTKAALISTTQDAEHPFRLIHTPKQTVYSSRAHKFQDGWKVFISTTDKYACFVDNCGMTQSIAVVHCVDEAEAHRRCDILKHDLFKFINNICRWGNFNNVRILQNFPEPDCIETIYAQFGITPEEQSYIAANL